MSIQHPSTIMKIQTKRIQKSTKREGLYQLEGSALRSPFHPFSPAEVDDCKQAYRMYLYQTLELKQDPIHVAKGIANEKDLMLSKRWKTPTVETMQGEVKQLLQKGSVTIGLDNAGAGEVLASYLKFKYNNSKQLDLEIAA